MKAVVTGREVFVIAHNIRSIYNVGSIFRTADAFGVRKIFLTGYTGTPEDGRVGKVALGAEQVVPWEYKRFPGRVIKSLKLEHPDIAVVALENNVDGVRPIGELAQELCNQPVVLVLGEETKGIPPALLKLCDDTAEIPMRGVKESLNVSVACGVALYIFSVSRC